jgi:hypothetical protein
MDDVPHLALPLRVVGDRFVSVQQDTVDELVATVGAITLFPIGYRVERPDFGIAELELTRRPLAALDVGAARVRVEVGMNRAEEGEA